MAMSRSSSASSDRSRSMPRRSLARRCERCCCTVATLFPLAFVYGLTTWAVWVAERIGFQEASIPLGQPTSVLAIILYCILNWCYTTAVFTSPGTPSDRSTGAGYSTLPTHEPAGSDAQSLTVKSTGELRYCKKCESRKPDRTHHCSTCKRCVLKMDHHCPWLATCVGLRNYKAFLLFLIYTSIFCWVCFGLTAIWLWQQALTDSRYGESLMPINYVLLCVIAGIIGLVLTGFTLWHVSLACRGMTTIECLEKTRYLTPVRKSLQRHQFGKQGGNEEQSYGQQLAEIHANALPGVTRPEEGEVILNESTDLEAGHQSSNATQALRQNYAEMERTREHDRYIDYLDEKDSEALPSAFDLGWRRNLRHLFGDRPVLWFWPICNTTGDGWHWEPSPKWLDARERIRHEREAQYREDQAFDSERNGWVEHSMPPPERHYFSPDGSPSSRLSMKTLRRRGSFDSVVDDDVDDLDIGDDTDGRG